MIRAVLAAFLLATPLSGLANSPQQHRYWGECTHPDHGPNGMMAVYYTSDRNVVVSGCKQHEEVNKSHRGYCQVRGD